MTAAWFYLSALFRIRTGVVNSAGCLIQGPMLIQGLDFWGLFDILKKHAGLGKTANPNDCNGIFECEASNAPICDDVSGLEEFYSLPLHLLAVEVDRLSLQRLLSAREGGIQTLHKVRPLARKPRLRLVSTDKKAIENATAAFGRFLGWKNWTVKKGWSWNINQDYKCIHWLHFQPEFFIHPVYFWLSNMVKKSWSRDVKLKTCTCFFQGGKWGKFSTLMLTIRSSSFYKFPFLFMFPHDSFLILIVFESWSWKIWGSFVLQSNSLRHSSHWVEQSLIQKEKIWKRKERIFTSNEIKMKERIQESRSNYLNFRIK